jgi:hypothetical protein
MLESSPKIQSAINDIKNVISYAFEHSIARLLVSFAVIGGLPGLFYILEKNQSPHPILYGLAIYAVFMVLLAIYALVMAFHSVSRKYIEISDDKYETLHYLAELDAKHYGLQRKLFQQIAQINEDGSCHTKYSTILLAFTDNITKMEFYQHTPSTNDGSGVIEVHAEQKESGEIKVVPNIVRQNHKSCYWELTFVPALKNGQELKYFFEVDLLPATFAMNYVAMKEKKLDFEYGSTTMSYPTEHFIRKMVFPKSFVPKDYGYDVWLGDAHVRHMNEYIRISQLKFFRTGRTEEGCFYIELHIQHPIHGLKYVLTWIPS